MPDVRDSEYFARAFTAIQQLVDEGIVLAGHDISAGGMVTALLEMCFQIIVWVWISIFHSWLKKI